MPPITISLTNYNALVNDDGSNLVGSVFDKVDILDVILTPVQAALSSFSTFVSAGDATEAAARAAADAAAAAVVRTVPFGGTGAATLTGVLKGNGAAAVTAIAIPADATKYLDGTGAFSVPAGAGASVDVGVCEGRLTLTTLTPVTTADVTGATSIKWTPYKGKYIALYDGASAWVLRAFAETSLALGTLTSGLPYDVFAYDNAGTLALELLAWTSGTARATALVLQDGVWVKTGATTRRYLGTFYTTSTTTTEDSVAKRFVWNYYHRVPRRLARVEATASWTYTTATVRQTNAAAANKVEAVVGVAEVLAQLRITSICTNDTSVAVVIGIGVDSTSAISADCYGGGTSNISQGGPGVRTVQAATLQQYPAIGYHAFNMLEWSGAVGTTTWYGSISGIGEKAATLAGSIEG